MEVCASSLATLYFLFFAKASAHLRITIARQRHRPRMTEYEFIINRIFSLYYGHLIVVSPRQNSCNPQVVLQRIKLWNIRCYEEDEERELSFIEFFFYTVNWPINCGSLKFNGC